MALERWHPKITAYRLIIVSLGIGLGTAKAWTAWRGETIASITLEWISGVVVSLSLFILSWFDNSDDAPTSISLLFSYDCADIIWRILYVPKPAYRSDERIHIIQPAVYSQHPPITGYRILVSAVVTVFGITKMICSYLGFNAAANAIDWVFVVIVSTSLYLLGLYEDNTCDSMPFLFTTDYSDTLKDIICVALTFTVDTLVFLGCIACPLCMISLSLIEGAHAYALKLIIFSLLLAVILLPISLLLFVLSNAGLFVSLRRRLLFISKRTWLYARPHGLHPSAERALVIGVACAKAFGHIGIHLVAIAYCVLLGIVFIGFISKITFVSERWDIPIVSSLRLPITFIILGIPLTSCVGAIHRLLQSLMRPVGVYIRR